MTTINCVKLGTSVISFVKLFHVFIPLTVSDNSLRVVFVFLTEHSLLCLVPYMCIAAVGLKNA